MLYEPRGIAGLRKLAQTRISGPVTRIVNSATLQACLSIRDKRFHYNSHITLYIRIRDKLITDQDIRNKRDATANIEFSLASIGKSI